MSCTTGDGCTVDTHLPRAGRCTECTSPRPPLENPCRIPTARLYRRNSDAAARRVHELIDEGVQAGDFRNLNGTFAAHVVAVAIDALQSGLLLDSTGLSAGDAFSELGDLLLDGLSR